MDDSLRRLSLVAAIAALGAGGAAAQGLPASLRAADLPHRVETRLSMSSSSGALGSVASDVRRPTALPPIRAMSGSGVWLGLPAETVSMRVRSSGLVRERREWSVRETSGSVPSRGGVLQGNTPPQPAAESVTIVQLLQRSEQLTHEAEMALRRGAVHSSREAAVGALRASAAAADLRSGGRDATGALELATTAIREVGDFVGRYGQVGRGDLQRMVDAHQTPVLKGCDTTALSPHAAADVYLDFARERLVEAAGGRREAAVSLGMLARAERARHDLHPELSESVAVACVRAAVATDPADARLANELGLQAMQLGLLREAQWALERSWAIEPSEPALRNLIETYQLAGDVARAQQLMAMLPQFAAEANSHLPEVMRVEPAEFAAISPPVQSPAAAAPRAVALKSDAAKPVAVGTPQPPSDGETVGTRRETATAQVTSDSRGVLGKVAGVMRRMWH